MGKYWSIFFTVIIKKMFCGIFKIVENLVTVFTDIKDLKMLQDRLNEKNEVRFNELNKKVVSDRITAIENQVLRKKFNVISYETEKLKDDIVKIKECCEDLKDKIDENDYQTIYSKECLRIDIVNIKECCKNLRHGTDFVLNKTDHLHNMIWQNHVNAANLTDINEGRIDDLNRAVNG